jgi:hypothetical protein
MPIADANFGADESAALLRELDRLRFQNEDPVNAGALSASPTVTVRPDLDYERGVHTRNRVLHNCSQNV